MREDRRRQATLSAKSRCILVSLPDDTRVGLHLGISLLDPAAVREISQEQWKCGCFDSRQHAIAWRYASGLYQGPKDRYDSSKKNNLDPRRCYIRHLSKKCV